MARRIGPKHTRCRRYGIKLCDSAKCPVVRRPYPPGQHGPKGTPRLSEYGIQLAEKQKAKTIYGILERRLDNVVFRLGFASSHNQARQFVSHGLVKVNGRKVTIPSFSVKPKEVITVAEKPKVRAAIAERLKGAHEEPATWLTRNVEQMSGTVNRLPEVTDVNQPLNMQLIVEHYSR